MNLIKKSIKTDKLISINYSNSGDMRGNVENLIIDVDEKIIKYRYSEGFNVPVLVTEYSISDADIDNLYEMIKKYNFPAWTNLPLSKMVVYDAPSKSITLTYDNSKIGGDSRVWFDIDYDTLIPSDGFILLHEFTNYMYSLMKEDNLINTYTEED